MNKHILNFTVAFVVIIYLATTLIPLAHHYIIDSPENNFGTEVFNPFQINGPTETEIDKDIFLLHDLANGEIISVPEKEFLIGVLASEMEEDIHEEALKAMVVASYSYYSFLREENKTANYHISFNSVDNSVYMKNQNMKIVWGENYEQNYTHYENVVESVYGQVVEYEGEIACTAFFTSSNGTTESAIEVWGEDIPYLLAVASPYDNFSGGIESTYTFTPEKVQELMLKNWSTAKFDFDLPYEKWFSNIEYTLGATVKSLNVCGFGITGEEFRRVFELSSPSFDVSYDGDKFKVRSKGQGGLVGMSKTGAAYMASEGADYKEILNWYYAEIEITQLEN